MMNKKSMLFLFLGVIVLGLSIWAYRFLSIDSCLDGGGRWDYDKGECIQSEKAHEIDQCLSSGKRWDFERNECK